MALDAPTAAATGRACPNCGAPALREWCAHCGQEAIVEQGALALTLRRQGRRIRHTVAALVLHPGQLTAEFRDGQRARSISPWRFAFNVMAIFFVLSFATDFRVANFPKQDPSGTLARAIATAAQQAKVDLPTFEERLDRRFNAVYTMLVVVAIGFTALLARLTHWRRRGRWSVDFVFALHLTAWSFFLNAIYLLALRAFGLTSYLTSADPRQRELGLALLAAVLLWQLGYVVVAFRRVYADGWFGAGAKAAAMVALRLLVDNAVIFLCVWLALASLSPGF
jgi:hypothetical protein